MNYKLKWVKLDLTDEDQVEEFLVERAMVSYSTGECISVCDCSEWIVSAYKRGLEYGMIVGEEVGT